MGWRDALRHRLRPISPSQGKRKCSIEMQPQSVTEQSLQVWRTLPPEIRHDPSMASFQQENERIRGSSTHSAMSDEDDDNDNDNNYNDNDNSRMENEGDSNDGSEFMSIRRNCDIHGHEDKSTDDEMTTTHSDHDHMNGPGNAKVMARRTQRKSKRSKEQRKQDKLWKKCGLLVVWIFAAAVLISVSEKHLLEKTLQIPQGEEGKFFQLVNKPTGDFRLKLHGAFNESALAAAASTHTMDTSSDSTSLPIHLTNDTTTTEGQSWLTIQPQISYYQNGSKVFKNILPAWQLPLISVDLMDRIPAVSRNYTYEVSPDQLDAIESNETEMRLHISSTSEVDLAIVLNYNPLIVDTRLGSVVAALILLIFYAVLVWELFERPFVAMVCSILSVTALACFNDRPNMDEIIQWMDMELLTLVFCMMLLVLILTETGVFDYLAVICFEISGGKIWPMIYSLCLVTCLVSSVLDNMTTVLLLTPVAIRLCEVMRVDPVPVVLGLIAHANIGGALTPIGDPISIIVSTNHYIAANGVSFLNFVGHTLPGVMLAVVHSCLYLRLYYHNMQTLRLNEPHELKQLRREIKLWQRAINAIAGYSKDADLVRGTLTGKIKQLKRKLHRLQRGLGSTDAYVSTLEELKLKYPIKNKVLLMQSAGALIFVIICFFIQSVPQLRTLPLGWVALLGVIVLLIVINRDDMELLLHRIEWTTLLFFAAMFVMMECVERLGLFASIGEFTEHVILSVNKSQRLPMAIFMILWTSALASSILDSIPVTAMMVKLLTSLVAKPSLGLPLQPLVWALTLGSSFGGNGTLYGASANVISAGIAEQHGYKISFTRYLRTVFPMMLGQITLVTIYLMVAHVIFEWH